MMGNRNGLLFFPFITDHFMRQLGINRFQADQGKPVAYEQSQEDQHAETHTENEKEDKETEYFGKHFV